MAVAGERTSLHNGLAFGRANRLLKDALLQTPRKEALLESAFIDLDTQLEGNYRDVLKRKGKSWVIGIGDELAELHTSHITAVVPFGDTYEHSRHLKQNISASPEEIKAASRELGVMIFEDIARQFMIHHAEGSLADEEVSESVFKAAFTLPSDFFYGDIARHMIEVRADEVLTDQDTTEVIPVISRIWAVLPERQITRLQDYRRMMAIARQTNNGFLADNAKMTLIIPANSAMAIIPVSVLAEEGIELVEFPVLTSQFYDFGSTMLAERAPSADFATKQDILKHITPPNQQPEEVRAAARRHRADRLPPTVATTYSAFQDDSTRNWHDRLRTAYPPSPDAELNSLEQRDRLERLFEEE